MLVWQWPLLTAHHTSSYVLFTASLGFSVQDQHSAFTTKALLWAWCQVLSPSTEEPTSLCFADLFPVSCTFAVHLLGQCLSREEREAQSHIWMQMGSWISLSCLWTPAWCLAAKRPNNESQDIRLLWTVVPVFTGANICVLTSCFVDTVAAAGLENKVKTFSEMLIYGFEINNLCQ